jgi:hypothetical protein
MDSLPTLQPKRFTAGFLARRDVPDTPLPFDSSGFGRWDGRARNYLIANFQTDEQTTMKQRTADKNVTNNIFSITSSQGCNMFFLKGNSQSNTPNSASNKRRPISGPP